RKVVPNQPWINPNPSGFAADGTPCNDIYMRGVSYCPTRWPGNSRAIALCSQSLDVQRGHCGLGPLVRNPSDDPSVDRIGGPLNPNVPGVFR
ncbi:unnamed protein product, partial [Closterium sp. Naga37s-1]